LFITTPSPRARRYTIEPRVHKDWAAFVKFLTARVTPAVNRALLGLHNLTLFHLSVLVSPYLAEGEDAGQGAHRDWHKADIAEAIASDPMEFPVSFFMTITPGGMLRVWSDSLDATFVFDSAGDLVSLPQSGDSALWHGATVHEGRDYVAPSPDLVWAARAANNVAPKECCHIRLHWYCASAHGVNKWAIGNKTQLIPEYDDKGVQARGYPEVVETASLRVAKRARRQTESYR
jgi:hypothetical protein